MAEHQEPEDSVHGLTMHQNVSGIKAKLGPSADLDPENLQAQIKVHIKQEEPYADA